MEIGTGKGLFDFAWKWLSDSCMIKTPLKNSQVTPACLVARCIKTGRIIGARIGEIIDKATLRPDTRVEALQNIPLPISRRLRKLAIWQAMETKHQFGHDNVFKHPETSESERIYLDCLVCVSKEVLPEFNDFFLVLYIIVHLKGSRERPGRRACQERS